MATEFGEDETDGPGDETGDKTAATAGDERDGSDRWGNYMDEGQYTIDVRHVEEMVGTTREAVDRDRVWRGRHGDETGGPGNETGDKTAATTGDERDGSDWWGNYTDEGELEFDEDEMAALEGQHLVAEFNRCTRWP